MEIKGDEFIKKVQLKQEKDEIEQRLNELNTQEAQYDEVAPSQSTQDQTASSGQTRVPPKMDRDIQIEEELEYSDLRLGGESVEKNETNKKKYLILGLILVILFLLTIIIIRLLTNDSEEDSFTKPTTENSILENENIEEQYQKIINEKLKTIKEEKEKEVLAEKEIDEKLNLEKIEQEEKVEQQKEVKPDIFEVKKTEEKKVVTTKKPVVTKEVVKPKPVQVKQTAKTVSNTITSKPSGTFVQVGAFSKMPTKKYLSSITQKGYKYKIYKVSINNKMFHKVLIGPYKSRGQARLAISDIKKKLNVSGAFILTF